MKERGFGTGPGSAREAPAARKVKGDGMGAGGGQRLRRRVGSALTGKRLGGAMGGWAVEEAWPVYGRGYERWEAWPRGGAGSGAPRPFKMAAPEVPEALAGGFCNRPRHRPDLPPPLPSFVFV